MVQNQVQKTVQKAKKSTAANKENMRQPYLTKSPSGASYVFRRAVPADIKSLFNNQREFKKRLGSDFQRACQECRELAVKTDRQIKEARAVLAGKAPRRASSAASPIQAEPSLVAIKTVTSDLFERVRTSVVEQVLNADKAQRFQSTDAVNPATKLEQIERVRNWADLAWHGDEVALYGWADMLAGTLKRNGVQLDEELRGTPQERELLVEYASAYRDALGLLKAAYSGEPVPSSAPMHGRERKALDNNATLVAKSLVSVVGEFLAHLAPGKRAMNEKHGFILPAFLEVTGDMPISELRQAHIKDFLLTVQKLPPRWSDIRRKEGKTIREIAAKDWGTTISLATYDGSYRASLHAFLERSVVDWQDIGFPTTLTTDVPYYGSRTSAVQKQRSLTRDEIQAVFFNEEMDAICKSPGKAYRFWLLAIELYTGARVREICQINPQYDWGCTNEIWWLRFTTAEGQSPDSDVYKSLKTSKPRTIPIHQELVNAGIISYLDSLKENGATRLFPQWSATDGDAGAAPSKWVSNYMRRRGLHGVANELGNAVRGSHTFRHTLLTHGKRNGVNLRCISGHKESTDNPVADGYEDETLLLPLDEMASRLAKLDYGLSLPTPVQAKLLGNSKL